MAILFPKNFDIQEIENDSEREFVDLLLKRLSPEWMVSPNYEFSDGKRYRETDVIIINPNVGMAIIEVKGGRVSVKDGKWIHNGEREDPEVQARGNSFALRSYLQGAMPEKSFKIAWGVCLPKSTSFSGTLPSDLLEEQLLLSPHLETLELCIERIIDTTNAQYCFSPQQIQLILDALYPEVNFTYDPNATYLRNREQLVAICEAQVDAIMSLEVHHRVMVVGAAGTGKTYLATRWAHSGLISDDEEPKRVLLTCYNDPLGYKFQELFQTEEFDDEDQSVVYAGPFMKTLLQLPGLPSPNFADTNSNEYWEVTLPAFIKDNLSKVDIRFDRIIVDEAQDFSPAWLELLEELLDKDGDNQLFMLFDQSQRLSDRGFEEPSIEDGWVRAELRTNVRNSFQIARLARQFLNGAAAPKSLPTAGGIEFIQLVSDEEIVNRVKIAVGAALADGLKAEQILVVASSSSLRDILRTSLGLGIAEERNLKIACETAHRAKGLEADCVVIAASMKGMRESELYVGITRAISKLTIIAPGETLKLLGR